MRISLAFMLLLSACAIDDGSPDDLGEVTDELTYLDSDSIPLRDPVVAFRGLDYNVQVVGVNTSGTVVWDMQNGSAWGTPHFTAVAPAYNVSPPPAGLRHLAAAQQADGKTFVFAYTSGALYYSKQLTAYGRVWSAWTYVGAAAAAPASIERNEDGRLEVVYLGSDGYVRKLRQLTANGSWSAPSSTGVASSGPPKIHKDAQGRLEIFAPIASGACGLKHWRQVAANGTGWTAPVHAAQNVCLRDISVGHQGGRTEIVARTTTNTPFRITRLTPDLAFNTPSGMSYSAPFPPAVQLKDDGRLVVPLWLDGTGGDPVSHAIVFAEIDPTNGSASWSVLPLNFRSMSEVRVAESLINLTEVYAQGYRFRFR